MEINTLGSAIIQAINLHLVSASNQEKLEAIDDVVEYLTTTHGIVLEDEYYPAGISATAPPSPLRVYIAGKVSGEPIHLTTAKFGAAQVLIKEAGYLPINPLQVVNNWHCPWPQAMRLCISALLNCDYIFLLPDWQYSKGATLEWQIASKLGIPQLKLP